MNRYSRWWWPVDRHMRTVGILMFLVVLSLSTALKASYQFAVFTEHNVRVFDGVTNEYDRLMLYERFGGDHSLGHRLSRAYYEWTGNPFTGAYNAILCLAVPQWLRSGTDLPVRATVALFVLLLGLYLLLGPVLSTGQLLVTATVITQLPFLTNPYNGIGTYVPDTVASIMLMAGLLLLLTFVRGGRNMLLPIGASVLFFLAVSMRFNFIVHVGAVSLMALWPTYKAWRTLTFAHRATVALVCSVIMMMAASLFLTHMDSFLHYYNTTIYDQVGLEEAVSVSISTFLSSMGWWGVVLLSVQFLAVSVRQAPRADIPASHLFLLALPFGLIYGIPIFVKNAPHIPHVLNSAFLTLPFVLLSAALALGKGLAGIRKGRPLLPIAPVFMDRLGAVTIILILAVSSLNFYSACRESGRTLPEHSAMRSFTDIVHRQSLSELPDTLRYMALFDDLVHWPVNTAMIKDHGMPVAPYLAFISKPTLLSCHSEEECDEMFTDELSRVGLVAVNDPSGAGNRILGRHRLASTLSETVFARVTDEDSPFLPIDTIGDPVHGRIIIFRRQRDS